MVLHETPDVIKLHSQLQGTDGLQLSELGVTQHSYDHYLLACHYKASIRVFG